MEKFLEMIKVNNQEWGQISNGIGLYFMGLGGILALAVALKVILWMFT